MWILSEPPSIYRKARTKVPRDIARFSNTLGEFPSDEAEHGCQVSRRQLGAKSALHAREEAAEPLHEGGRQLSRPVGQDPFEVAPRLNWQYRGILTIYSRKSLAYRIIILTNGCKLLNVPG